MGEHRLALANTKLKTSVDQKFEIRTLIPSDIAAISDIQKHPLIAPQQYRVGYFSWLEIGLARLNADAFAESFEYRVTTIVLGSDVIGYISELRTNAKSRFSAKLGWNLHPDCWGRGLMTSALNVYISDLFSNEKCTSIIADCFAGNDRCLRLLSRLAFTEAPIGQMERFLIYIFRLCPHRILRHELDVVKWNARTKNE